MKRSLTLLMVLIVGLFSGCTSTHPSTTEGANTESEWKIPLVETSSGVVLNASEHASIVVAVDVMSAFRPDSYATALGAHWALVGILESPVTASDCVEIDLAAVSEDTFYTSFYAKEVPQGRYLMAATTAEVGSTLGMSEGMPDTVDGVPVAANWSVMEVPAVKGELGWIVDWRMNVARDSIVMLTVGRVGPLLQSGGQLEVTLDSGEDTCWEHQDVSAPVPSSTFSRPIWVGGAGIAAAGKVSVTSEWVGPAAMSGELRAAIIVVESKQLKSSLGH